MSEPRFTKGPWEWIAEDESLLGLWGPKYGEDHVLSIGKCNSCIKSGLPCMNPSDDDANLIAAAPDLYAACDEIYTALTSPSRILFHSTRKEMQPVVALLRDALAKARGAT